MATKKQPKHDEYEQVKGVRLDPEMIRRIEEAGSAWGIRNFSEKVRFLINQGLLSLEHRGRAA